MVNTVTPLSTPIRHSLLAIRVYALPSESFLVWFTCILA